MGRCGSGAFFPAAPLPIPHPSARHGPAWIRGLLPGGAPQPSTRHGPAEIRRACSRSGWQRLHRAREEEEEKEREEETAVCPGRPAPPPSLSGTEDEHGAVVGRRHLAELGLGLQLPLLVPELEGASPRGREHRQSRGLPGAAILVVERSQRPRASFHAMRYRRYRSAERKPWWLWTSGWRPWRGCWHWRRSASRRRKRTGRRYSD
ncbi:hypothetical protein PVAP13_2NG348503 [Panicum virgatum]|uniref:Uncharacterized protein n=1 Tax=Panicum virgatum TaxID=38727 RepID=A0A8T0VF00_PANVG|nr:hypothetical protein PVAP13_2NG348503 [Panicum virgatum]